MTRDDIDRLAQAADDYANSQFPAPGYHPAWALVRDDKFAALVAAAERAECIDDCECEATVDGTAQRIIARIRARGEKE